MLPLRWTVEALDDLDQLTDYIAEHNPRAAMQCSRTSKRR
jgi:toxin ParE1/3/4